MPSPGQKPTGDDEEQAGVLGYRIAGGDTQLGNIPFDQLADEIAPRIAPGIGDLLAGRFAAAGETQELDADKVRELARAEAETVLARESPPVKVEIKLPGENATVKVNGAHKHFAKLLFLVGQGHNVYLYGPPGSGKSHAAKQAAETLKRAYGYISLNPQTPDSRLLGYLDASGNYRSTVFRRVYEGGGVFCIDELDNASPSLLTTLNGCLENGIGAFPDQMVQRHPDFVVVATGNTSGKGANPAFPDRRPFDMAFAERFSYLEWGYDTGLEKRITLAINPDAGAWLQWVNQLRKWAAANLPRLIVSPRASFKLATYTRGECPLKLEELVNAVVFRGLDGDSVAKALAACPLPGGK